MKDWAAAVALRETRDSGAPTPLDKGGLAFMPHKGLLTAQLAAGGVRLNVGGVFDAVGCYQGALL